MTWAFWVCCACVDKSWPKKAGRMSECKQKLIGQLFDLAWLRSKAVWLGCVLSKGALHQIVINRYLLGDLIQLGSILLGRSPVSHPYKGVHHAFSCFLLPTAFCLMLLTFYDALTMWFTDFCNVLPTGDMFTEEQNELVESAAEMLYGLIHVRYILTSKGLAAMVKLLFSSSSTNKLSSDG